MLSKKVKSFENPVISWVIKINKRGLKRVESGKLVSEEQLCGLFSDEMCRQCLTYSTVYNITYINNEWDIIVL